MRKYRMPVFTWALVLFAAAIVSVPVKAAQKTAPSSAAVSMKGEIIDPQCYFIHGSHGPDHAACAAKCARGGQGLAFLDDASGVVYPIIASTHGGDQNAGLIPHLGKPVQVKAVVLRHASNAVVMLQSVVDRSAGVR